MKPTKEFGGYFTCFLCFVSCCQTTKRRIVWRQWLLHIDTLIVFVPCLMAQALCHLLLNDLLSLLAVNTCPLLVQMFAWFVPGGSLGTALPLFLLNFIIGGVIGGFVLVWRLLVAAWYIPLTIYRLFITRGTSYIPE